MATVTLRIPDDKHQRLKQLAGQRKISVNKLMDELATVAIAQNDAESQFKVRASKGDVGKGLDILDKLDLAFDSSC